MKHLLGFIIILIIFSCQSRKIKYSGLDNMFIGVEQIILYENGEFYLELGAGGTEGKYKINQDTINLNYYSKPGINWPNQFTMTDKYFSSVTLNDSDIVITITRQNKADSNKK